MKLSKEINILLTLTSANLKSRYRNTFYGFFWVVLNPALTYLVQVFAFKLIFQNNFPNYEVYLLAGLLPWLFVVQSVDICTGIFLHNGFTLKNLPINPILLPLSQMIDNLINFISAFLLLIFYFCIVDKLSWLVLPNLIIPIFLLFIATTSFIIMLAVMNVKYQDLKFVTSFVFTGLFFLTPIFYSIKIVPENIRLYVAYNPLYFLIRPFQELFINGTSGNYYSSMLNSFLVTLLISTASYFLWKKMKGNIGFYA